MNYLNLLWKDWRDYEEYIDNLWPDVVDYETREDKKTFKLFIEWIADRNSLE